ncbi:MAG TPA: cytochrome c oxidase subunit II [Longimicrobiales bacterium]|nr:cytochrome c oxidase subunit II [Longimicrobiales bacterium]
MRRLARRAAVAVLAGSSASGCAAPHSMWAPVSEAGESIEALWWWLLVICTVVMVVVLTGYAYALLRRRPASGGRPEPAGRSLFWILVAGALVPAVILAGLTAVTLRASARIAGAGAEDALEVEVVGHQFWWEIRYAETGVVTANELHLPAGRPTRVRLVTADVIHSLWIPRLHGKLDLTPGRAEELVLAPREAGEYRGFCAEFCGTQHALMGLLVIAQPEAEFEAWLAAQARPAGSPATPEAAAGAALFTRLDCHLCHRVRGSGAAAPATVGPDLTHVASRRTLGAATVANAPGTLATWIRDPHVVKPGVRMPATRLADPELGALVAYLGGLR